MNSQTAYGLTGKVYKRPSTAEEIESVMEYALMSVRKILLLDDPDRVQAEVTIPVSPWVLAYVIQVMRALIDRLAPSGLLTTSPSSLLQEMIDEIAAEVTIKAVAMHMSEDPPTSPEAEVVLQSPLPWPPETDDWEDPSG